MTISAFRESHDIDVFIARLECTAKLYHIETKELAVEFFSLFTGKALGILQRLGPDNDSYEHMKVALRKANVKSRRRQARLHEGYHL